MLRHPVSTLSHPTHATPSPSCDLLRRPSLSLAPRPQLLPSCFQVAMHSNPTSLSPFPSSSSSSIPCSPHSPLLLPPLPTRAVPSSSQSFLRFSSSTPSPTRQRASCPLQASQGRGGRSRRDREDDYDRTVEEEERLYGMDNGKAFSFSADGKQVRANLGGTRISLPKGSLWQLAVPAAMVLGLAAVIGPLIIGLAVGAVALGAALSMGALALSFVWMPFFLMVSFMLMSFLAPVGMVSLFSLGLIIPKVISMLIAGGGVALGWFVVSKIFLPSKPSSTTASSSSSSSSASTASSSTPSSAKFKSKQGSQTGPFVKAEARSIDEEEEARQEAEIRRRAAELREFDSMMAEREEERRVEEWRSGLTDRRR